MTRRRVGMSGVALIVAALSFAGCDQPRNALGTTSSACFRAIAPAHRAVHHGTLMGVRKADIEQLRRHIPAAAQLGDTTVCLVAYRGPYTAGSVQSQVGDQSGNYAIVAVELKRDTVLAAFVTQRLPVRFRHL